MLHSGLKCVKRTPFVLSWFDALYEGRANISVLIFEIE